MRGKQRGKEGWKGKRRVEVRRGRGGANFWLRTFWLRSVAVCEAQLTARYALRSFT